MGADGFVDKNIDPVEFLQSLRRAADREMVLAGPGSAAVGQIAEGIERRRDFDVRLTVRERQVLSVAAEGLTAREIAVASGCENERSRRTSRASTGSSASAADSRRSDSPLEPASSPSEWPSSRCRDDDLPLTAYVGLRNRPPGKTEFPGQRVDLPCRCALSFRAEGSKTLRQDGIRVPEEGGAIHASSLHGSHHLVGRPQGRAAEEGGATAVEYALMVALIAVVIIAAVAFIGTSSSEKFQEVGDAVSGA